MKTVCPFCNHEYNVEKNWINQTANCNNCKQDFTVVPAQICHACGSANSPDKTKCVKCGQFLQNPDENNSNNITPMRIFISTTQEIYTVLLSFSIIALGYYSFLGIYRFKLPAIPITFVSLIPYFVVIIATVKLCNKECTVKAKKRLFQVFNAMYKICLIITPLILIRVFFEMWGQDRGAFCFLTIPVISFGGIIIFGFAKSAINQADTTVSYDNPCRSIIRCLGFITITVLFAGGVFFSINKFMEIRKEEEKRQLQEEEQLWQEEAQRRKERAQRREEEAQKWKERQEEENRRWNEEVERQRQEAERQRQEAEQQKRREKRAREMGFSSWEEAEREMKKELQRIEEEQRRKDEAQRKIEDQYFELSEDRKTLIKFKGIKDNTLPVVIKSDFSFDSYNTYSFVHTVTQNNTIECSVRPKNAGEGIDVKVLGFPRSVRTVSHGAFADRRDIIYIKLSYNDLETIENEAFRNCTGLIKAEIHCSNLHSLDRKAFDDFRKVAISSNTFKSGDHGEIIDVKKNKLLWFPPEYDGEYIIPDNIINIAPGAFTDCKVSKVTISPKVRFIPAKTFVRCGNLSEVTLKNKYAKVRANTFVECNNVKIIR